MLGKDGKVIHMIKNIIFDVGDVLFDYRPVEMLMEIGVSREEALRLDDEMFYDPLWRILDMGTMSQEKVIAEYGRRYPDDAEEIAWFITHGERMHVARPQVWKRVHQLKEKGYRIYLLSNYSEDLFHKHTKGASFMEDLDGMVVSYQIHMAKPDRGIYQYLFHKYALKPEECVFYDDREENVKAAIQQGMESVQITSQEQLLRILDATVNG